MLEFCQIFFLSAIVSGDIFKPVCKKMTDVRKEDFFFFIIIISSLQQSPFLWLRINILGALREKKKVTFSRYIRKH